MSLAGVDIGTSSSKGIVIDAAGTQLGEARSGYELDLTPGGGYELPSGRVEQAARSVIAELAALASGAGDPIAAISFSVSGNEATPLDASGAAVRSTIMAMDGRGMDVVEWWERELGPERVYEITGIPVHPMHPLVRMMWMREHEPDLFARVERFLCWQELIALRLGAEPIIDQSMASCTMAYEIEAGAWSEEMLARSGIDPALFPAIAPTGTPIGEVGSGPAEELGLDPGVVVVSGGYDQPMAALGAGQLRPGDAGISSGSWEALLVVIDRPLDGARALGSGYVSSRYVTDGSFYTVANNAGGGSVLRWFRDTLGQEELRRQLRDGTDAFELLIAQASERPTGILVTPHFAGSYNPWMDTGATGAVVGLTLATSRGELIKAVLEGVTFELRENLERLEAAGVECDELIASGGGARSEAWLQLRADITGKPVRAVAVDECGCLAAACAAGVGIGAFAEIGEPIAELVKTRSFHEPDLANKAVYDEIFAEYQKVYPAIRDIHPRRNPKIVGAQPAPEGS